MSELDCLLKYLPIIGFIRFWSCCVAPHLLYIVVAILIFFTTKPRAAENRTFLLLFVILTHFESACAPEFYWRWRLTWPKMGGGGGDAGPLHLPCISPISVLTSFYCSPSILMFPMSAYCFVTQNVKYQYHDNLGIIMSYSSLVSDHG